MKLTNDQREAYLLYLDEHKQGCVREDRRYYQEEIDKIEDGESPDENEFRMFLDEIGANIQIK